ncbi:hypothetical protein GCM10009610_64750 [Pseudonocardia xinjiangensis]
MAFAGYSGGLVAITLAGFNFHQYKQRLVQAEQLLTQTRIAAAADTRAVLWITAIRLQNIVATSSRAVVRHS